MHMYPILDSNSLISILYPRLNCLKPIPFTVAHANNEYCTQYMAELPQAFFATFKKDLQVLIFKMELYWHSPVVEEKSTG